MFDSIADIRRLRKIYNGKMRFSGVDTFKALGELEEAALKSGALPRKVKELIALGISIDKSCYG